MAGGGGIWGGLNEGEGGGGHGIWGSEGGGGGGTGGERGGGGRRVWDGGGLNRSGFFALG
jgi:hypothetical protein